MEDGEIIVEGSYEDVKNHDKFKSYAQSNLSLESEETSEVKAETPDPRTETSTGKLIEAEGRQEGRVSLLHYLHYIRLMNSLVFLLTVSLYCLGEGVLVLSNFVLVEEISLSEHFKSLLLWRTQCCHYFLHLQHEIHQTVLDKTMHAPLSRPSAQQVHLRH